MTTEAPGHVEATLLIDAAARRLGVSRRTVYYRIREGRLRTIRTRGGSLRVLASSIEALRREGAAPVRDAPVALLRAKDCPLRAKSGALHSEPLALQV